MVRSEVIGQIPLELALLAGFSAPVVAMLSEMYPIDVLMFHLSGDSSKGKTTAEELAVSSFGSPSIRKDGLIKTWSSTSNALTAILRNNFGVPIAIDEASIRQGEDFTSYIYRFVQGKDKDRLNKEAQLKKGYSWSTTIISSGEGSLKTECRQHTGIRVRLIEVDCDQFTRSADNSNRIKQVVNSNYGLSGPVFVDFLINEWQDSLLDLFKNYRDKLRKEVTTPDALTERFIDKLAVVLATAYLVEKAFHFGLHLSELGRFLLSLESKSSEDRDIGERALEHFSESFSANVGKFYQGQKPVNSGMTVWGRYYKLDGTIQIVILKDKFNEIMRSGGFADTDIILGKWKAKGLIQCEKSHNTVKRTIVSGVPVRCVVVNLPEAVAKEPIDRDSPEAEQIRQLKMMEDT